MAAVKRESGKLDTAGQAGAEPPKVEQTAIPVVWCERWKEFKEVSRGADAVALEWSEEKGLVISALSKGTVYKYILKADGFKSWLSYQLGIPEEMVIEGEITFPGTQKT